MKNKIKISIFFILTLFLIQNSIAQPTYKFLENFDFQPKKNQFLANSSRFVASDLNYGISNHW
ncbi:MAG: hypothetical protein ABIO44_07905 [Saprospiraceae bacterium]